MEIEDLVEITYALAHDLEATTPFGHHAGAQQIALNDLCYKDHDQMLWSFGTHQYAAQSLRMVRVRFAAREICKIGVPRALIYSIMRRRDRTSKAPCSRKQMLPTNPLGIECGVSLHSRIRSHFIGGERVALLCTL